MSYLSITFCLFIFLYQWLPSDSLKCHCKQKLSSDTICLLSKTCFAYASCVLHYTVIDCLRLGLANCFNLSLLEMEVICSEDFGNFSTSCCNKSRSDCNQTLYEPSTTISSTYPRQITVSFATTHDVRQVPSGFKLVGSCLWEIDELLFVFVPMLAAFLSILAIASMVLCFVTMWCRWTQLCKSFQRTEAVFVVTELKL